MGEISFQSTLQSRGPGVAVILTDEQVTAVGEGPKRFPVVATVNGHSYRTTVVRMRGEFMFGLSKEVRAAAGVEAGETVPVTLALDAAERTVQLPPKLAAALAADGEAAAIFERLAFTHRKEYAGWIAEATREETRERRVTQALEMIRAGQTRS